MYKRQATVWLIFCAFALAVAGLSYLLQTVLSWQLSPPMAALVQAGLAAGAYPAVAAILTRIHVAMQQAESLA